MRILRPPYPIHGEFHAVDPGKDYYALAQFGRQSVPLEEFDCFVLGTPLAMRLEYVRMGTPGDWKAPMQNLVIEMPQIYRTGQARLQDTADLIFSTGVIAARYENVIRYLPAEWKGQVPKQLHQERIMAALTPAERKILDGIKKKDLHHILDAVGLGLFHVGRLGR